LLLRGHQDQLQTLDSAGFGGQILRQGHGCAGSSGGWGLSAGVLIGPGHLRQGEMAARLEFAKRLLAASDLGLTPEVIESKPLADLPGQLLTPREGLGV